MNIAEKLTTIAENVPRVYWSGHSVGHYTGSQEGYDSGLSDKENEINEHLAEPIATINDYLKNPIDPVSPHNRISYIDENIPQVYENGRNDWWLKFQQEKEAYGYRNAFWGGSWTDEIYNPVIDIVAIYGKNQNDMFRSSAITTTKVPIYFKHVGATMVFNGSNVQTIPLLDVVEAVTYVNWFTGCNNLTEITMSGVIGNDISFQDSPLNKASTENIISCLSVTASGKTLILKESAVINAFGSLSSQEWLNLINTKSNWQISTI